MGHGPGQPHSAPGVTAVPRAPRDGGLGKEVLGAVLLSRARVSTHLQRLLTKMPN